MTQPVIKVLNGVGTVNGVTLRNKGSGRLFLNDSGAYDRIKLIAYSELMIKNFTDFDPDTCNLSQGDVVAFSSVSNAPGKPAWDSTECSGIIVCTYTNISDKYYKYLAFPAQQHTGSLFAYGDQQKIGGVLQPLVWKYVKGEDTP